MKSVKLVLTSAVYLMLFAVTALAQIHYPAGDKLTRADNRLMSVKSEPGAQLHPPVNQFSKKSITIDADMSELDWQNAQTVSQFVDSAGQKDLTTVKVLFDKENIYLFWVVEELDGITANTTEDDTVITGDDYVQINLKPWLGDDVKFARDYYYSIAVNPAGTIWDAYWDPYLDGYFFSSWDSKARLATSQQGDIWFVEMAIPFSHLDHTSDVDHRWNLDFRHASKPDRTKPTRLYAPQVGITVRQGIMVRRAAIVGYYWTRPEFMMEVKPQPRSGLNESVKATSVKATPAVNGRPDRNLWSGAPTIEINRTDRTGEFLTEKTARAKVAATAGYLCFRLEADGAKVDKTKSINDIDTGMGKQIKGINGVYVDKTLFSTECFWIILQPRTTNPDIIHQPYYLIKVNSNGKVSGISYDEFGTPDRNWQGDIEIDIYNTSTGWGAEVTVALNSFDLPPGCTDTWGFNLFRNRMLPVKGEKLESKLQAWLYTASDFLNPAHFGTLTDVAVDKAGDVRPGLKRKTAKMREKIDAYSAEHSRDTKKLSSRLKRIKLKTQTNLAAAEKTLEQIDNALGVIDAKQYYSTEPHPAKGGYALLDVQMLGKKGWAVGPLGTILRTTNGGKSWQSVDIDTDADLYRVFFVNGRKGWAAGGRIRMAKTNKEMAHDERGGYGYIFHTTDGGKTWKCQYGERGRHIFGLHFVDDKTGYACGELGLLLKTDDGGKHWRQLNTTNTRRWLYGMAFKDKANGFIVGESETVLKTTDGGATWAKLDAPADRQFYGFRSFYRDIEFNGSTGCIVGQNGAILISNDGGQTWQPKATFIDPKVRELLDLTSVDFATEKLGFIVGELGTRILITEDAGKSWTMREVSNTDWLRAVCAGKRGEVVLVGEREKILTSTNNGFSWTTVRADKPKADVLILTAHGDDSAIRLGSFMAHYGINEGKSIVDIEVCRDAHSVEYLGEIYNLEHNRFARMVGARVTTYFDEFENGNNGCDYYHLTTRLWEGEENVVRHIVAAIRAYRPDVVIAHAPIFGEYDKPGHKLAGRAGFRAFDMSGGPEDLWPDLTQLGLEPWQAKKLYCLDSESFPPTIATKPIADIPVEGTTQTCWKYSQHVMCVFQSQGIHNVVDDELCLVKSLVAVPEKETSVFDGL